MTVQGNSEGILCPFSFSEEKDVYRSPILTVREKTAFTSDGQSQLQVHTLRCANWVNVVPITASGHIVLVEQYRFGIGSETLEVPGGAVDKGEKDTTLSALRELEEETGLTSKRILSLPGFYPNPALQGNRVVYFIAFDVHPLETPIAHNDPFEVIKLHYVPFKECIAMVKRGQISHALSALALLLAEPYCNGKFE